MNVTYLMQSARTWTPRFAKCPWVFAQGQFQVTYSRRQPVNPYGQQHRSVQFSCVRNVASFSDLLFISISMIPLWTIPMAAVTGNTLILKPSERDPGAAMIIAELCERSGNMTPIRLSSACSCVRRSASWRCQCGAWNYPHRQHHL